MKAAISSSTAIESTDARDGHNRLEWTGLVPSVSRSAPIRRLTISRTIQLTVQDTTLSALSSRHLRTTEISPIIQARRCIGLTGPLQQSFAFWSGWELFGLITQLISPQGEP